MTFIVILVTLVGQGLTLPFVMRRAAWDGRELDGDELTVARSAAYAAGLEELARFRVAWNSHGELFDRLSPIVERTPTATRQLASRARRRVWGAAASSAAVPMARQRELVDAFLAAARTGDFEALLHVLDPDVVVRGDTAAARGPFAGALEVHGAPEVAAQALLFSRLAPVPPGDRQRRRRLRRLLR